jgi:UDP-N-acetylglucosamine:LPS N-acetylglucosamine transferase
VNAQVLVDAGAAILIDDARDPAANRAPLLAALERLTDPTTRTFMASAAQRLGRPRAAADVAAWLCG